jgi:PhnB protein
MTDPFEALAVPDQRRQPRPAFRRALRDRLVAELGLAGAPTAESTPDEPVVDLPDRRPIMTTATAAPTRTAITPYLAVHDGAGALAFYAAAFGADEAMRIVGDDGRLGHAEFSVGGSRFYLSDEYPEVGVVSPRTLGGTTVTLHLEVEDVDAAYGRAVAAGATALAEPEDQPHGARHGTLLDPYGHRWMLSQTIEQLSATELGSRMGDAGFIVETGTAAGAAAAVDAGRIWAAVNAADAPRMIGFLIEVLGFEEQLVVPGAEPGVVEHSQLVWPEGGTVQVATAHRPGNAFSEQPVGGQSLYVITADPDVVYRRCVEAEVEIVAEPSSPDYDPDGSVFSIRDHEGNLWSFGTYAGA